jgi:hypothetical protein
LCLVDGVHYHECKWEKNDFSKIWAKMADQFRLERDPFLKNAVFCYFWRLNDEHTSGFQFISDFFWYPTLDSIKMRPHIPLNSNWMSNNGQILQ